MADADSELARVVANGRFGINVPPLRSEDVASALERLADAPQQLEVWGQTGRAWVEQFEQGRVLAAFLQALRLEPRNGARFR